MYIHALSIEAWSARLVLIQLSDVADFSARWQQARMLVGRKQISRRIVLAATGGALTAIVIGTRTGGAEGDVSLIPLPGGLTGATTGIGVL